MVEKFVCKPAIPDFALRTKFFIFELKQQITFNVQGGNVQKILLPASYFH